MKLRALLRMLGLNPDQPLDLDADIVPPADAPTGAAQAASATGDPNAAMVTQAMQAALQPLHEAVTAMAAAQAAAQTPPADATPPASATPPAEAATGGTSLEALTASFTEAIAPIVASLAPADATPPTAVPAGAAAGNAGDAVPAAGAAAGSATESAAASASGVAGDGLPLQLAQTRALLAHYAPDVNIEHELPFVTGLTAGDDGAITGEAAYRPAPPDATPPAGRPSGTPSPAGASGAGAAEAPAEAPTEISDKSTSAEVDAWVRSKSGAKGAGAPGVTTIDPSTYSGDAAGVPTTAPAGAQTSEE